MFGMGTRSDWARVAAYAPVASRNPVRAAWHPDPSIRPAEQRLFRSLLPTADTTDRP